jgi:hypothetical protein
VSTETRLTLRTDIPFGNACDVKIVRDAETHEVRWASDPRGASCSLWFCFRLQRKGPTGGETPVRLVWKHASNCLGMINTECARPVVRAPGGAWQRLGPCAVRNLPDGQEELCWDVLLKDAWIEVAWCYPYGPEDVQRLVAQTDGYWKADPIGVSQKARAMTRLSNDYAAPGDERPGFYIVARQHAGEVSGTWLLDGLMRELARRDEQSCLVWAVPLSHIDGVIEGDYGKRSEPCDLNRAWGRKGWRHEVECIQQDIRRWADRCRPALGLDLHSPGAGQIKGVYCPIPDPEEHPDWSENVRPWTTALEGDLDTYACEYFAQPPRRKKIPREGTNYTSYMHGQGWCGLCIETPYARVREQLLTIEDYREIGARVARALLRVIQAA